MTPRPAATVLVPLHRSEPWVDVVEANLRQLTPEHRVVVSDATEEDGALQELRRRLDGHAGLEWVGARPIEPGWVAHYEDLRQRVATPLFMWLPHDDEIDTTYVDRCVDALERSPDAVGATGDIECVEGEDLIEVPNQPMPDLDDHAATHRAHQLLFGWNLGVAFRAVFRTERTVPLLHTDDEDRWADIVWLYGLALDGPMVRAHEAVYRKRFYRTSTHRAWGLHPHAVVLPHLVREVLRRPELPGRDQILVELAHGTASRVAADLDRLERRRHKAEVRVEQLDAEVNRTEEELGRLEAALAAERASLDAARAELALGWVDRVLRRLRRAAG